MAIMFGSSSVSSRIPTLTLRKLSFARARIGSLPIKTVWNVLRLETMGRTRDTARHARRHALTDTASWA